MATRSAGPDIPPVVVIVGETGSGKTALAIALAKHFDGEIICADSRTVYKGMTIGTAKPSSEEQAGIPHYGLDLVEPGEQFTAYDFQQLAYRMIAEIAGRGKLPIIVGGTGLYIDAVLYDFQFRKKPSAKERAVLESLPTEALQQKIGELGYDLPENATNRRHLIRLLEAGPSPNQPREPRHRTLVLGLRVPLDQLHQRIEARVELMITRGLSEEVETLLERHHGSEALKAPGYKAIARYVSGEIGLEQAKQQFVRDDLRLAKRQRTWFKRNTHIHWLDAEHRLDEAVDMATTFLAS